jgi:hypothetical protein
MAVQNSRQAGIGVFCRQNIQNSAGGFQITLVEDVLGFRVGEATGVNIGLSFPPNPVRFKCGAH